MDNIPSQGEAVCPVPDRRHDYRRRLEIQCAREYVEEMVVSRLCRTRPTDWTDEQVEPVFKQVLPVLAPTMQMILDRTYIPGFTREDLESFMYLKIHQVIRRGLYDPSRRPNGLFISGFNNLMHDIHRDMQRAKGRGLHEDTLDTTGLYDFNENMLYASVSLGVEWD